MEKNYVLVYATGTQYESYGEEVERFEREEDLHARANEILLKNEGGNRIIFSGKILAEWAYEPYQKVTAYTHKRID
jgi:hypothetical protein